MTKSKMCGKCGRRRAIEHFYRNAASKDGFGSQCKECMDARRKANRAKIAEHPKVVPRRKKCRDCGRTKSASAFSPMPSSGDGLYSYCKKCKADRVKDHRGRNQEEVNRKARERGATAEGRRATRESNLKTKFGVGHAYYEARLADQGGTCAICLTPPSPNAKHFAIDHVHDHRPRSDLRLRGVLCHNCNRALGLIDDDRRMLLAAAEYLERFRRGGNR